MSGSGKIGRIGEDDNSAKKWFYEVFYNSMHLNNANNGGNKFLNTIFLPNGEEHSNGSAAYTASNGTHFTANS